ncbi:MAG: glycosyl hydrolase [Acidobacteriota bacterium]|nr:glycosyl hydrolase [Acidobacteriota bacterium]
MVALTGAVALAAPVVPASVYKGLKYREIGPYRGGRVLAVTGVPGHPSTWYFGAVVGGVWKTVDGGRTWDPLFQHEPVASIGAIAVAPSNPNIIYVGTGEAAPRENISFGDGVYKSLDGGKTWTHLGLDGTRHIGRILVDPQNPDIVMVAALGPIYSEQPYATSPDRGVYRSTDGGATWQKVLYKDEHTGAIDLSFDPDNPAIVYAALWQMGRTPWSLTSGGPGSGLYKSSDEGKTWHQLTGHGLPGGVLGKIGVSAAGGDRVYAIVEAEDGGLYRSDDGGDSWTLVNGDQQFRQRAWYFTRVYADPTDPDTVYTVSTGFYRSTDGGETFQRVNVPHGDNHGCWIDPSDGQRLIVGNDGGATISVNGGKTWSSLYNQPTAQFYHVATDNRFPYYVYGAQQDNSTVAIASRSDFNAIGRRDWYQVGGGESGYVLPDPTDPDIVYAGAYFGILTRYDRHTGQVRDISPWPEDPDGWPASVAKHRFTWTAPLAFSPQDPHVLYTASQVLFRSTDGGGSWTAISPDLSRNDKSKQQSSGGPITKDNASAEYYDLIYSIAPSPVRKGEIWIGTDDGLVQLTEDEGKTWQNVTPPGMPAWAKVALIEASPFDAGTAYVSVDAHKLGNFKPYIFRTRDFGKTWTPITDGIAEPAYVHAVRSDTVRKGLLFAGTETGAYVSFDDGDHWQSLQLNLPTTGVRDFAVKNDDLVVATHGRSFWILDDITPLRQATAAVAEQAAHLFTPAPAIRFRPGNGPDGHVGLASNPPDGATIDYYLKDKVTGPVSLDVYDPQGRLVRHFTSEKQEPPPHLKYGRAPKPEQLPTGAGFHRIVWNLRYDLPPYIRAKVAAVYDMGGPLGPMVLPGTYQVKLTVAGHTETAPLKVVLDPRVHVAPAALQAQFDLMRQTWEALAEDHVAVNGILSLHAQLEALQARLAGVPKGQPIVAAAKALDGKILAVEGKLYQPKSEADEEQLNYPVELNSQLAYLQTVVDSADAAPTKQSIEVFGRLRRRLDEQLAAWKALQAKDLAALNAQMQKDGIAAVAPAPVASTSLTPGRR